MLELGEKDKEVELLTVYSDIAKYTDVNDTKVQSINNSSTIPLITIFRFMDLFGSSTAVWDSTVKL